MIIMGDNADNKPNMSLGTIIKLKAKANRLKTNKQQHEKKKFMKDLYEKVDFAHHKAIPVEYLREFTPLYRYTIGSLLILTYLGLFGYFVYFFYSENISAQFIAIEEGDNNCNEVTKAFSSISLAGANGAWEGALNFDYSDAPVQVTFRNIEATTEDFISLFKKQKERLIAINGEFKKNNLGNNILLWTNFKNSVRTGNTEQTFQFVGDPAMVFDGQIFLSSVAGADTGGTALCDGPATSFDQNSGLFHSSFDYDDDYTFCGAFVFKPYDIAFALQGLIPTVDIKLDSRSFMTAMSLNRGGLNRSSSYDVQVMKKLSAVTRGTQYTYLKLEDIRYPGMKPVYCVLGSWCLVQVGRLVFLPVFDHFGDSIDPNAKPCECGVNGDSEYCNTFDFILGLVAMGSLTGTNREFLIALQSFQDYFGTFDEFNSALSPIIRTLVNGNSKITVLQQFVSDTGLPLKIIAFRSINSFEQIISNYGYELANGSCSGTLSSALLKWDLLAQIPPESLTERYITCTRNQQISVFDGLGLGMANSDFCMRMFAYLVLPFLLWLFKLLFGVHFIDPAERTLENFEEILQKAREKTEKEIAVPKGGSGRAADVPPKSKFSKQDREEAAKIIRLLSIALLEEEEEDEEERREHHGLIGGLATFQTNQNNAHRDSTTTTSHVDGESANRNAVELFTKNPKRNYVAVHPMEIIGDDHHQP